MDADSLSIFQLPHPMYEALCRTIHCSFFLSIFFSRLYDRFVSSPLSYALLFLWSDTLSLPAIGALLLGIRGGRACHELYQGGEPRLFFVLQCGLSTIVLSCLHPFVDRYPFWIVTSYGAIFTFLQSGCIPASQTLFLRTGPHCCIRGVLCWYCRMLETRIVLWIVPPLPA